MFRILTLTILSCLYDVLDAVQRGIPMMERMAMPQNGLANHNISISAIAIHNFTDTLMMSL